MQILCLWWSHQGQNGISKCYVQTNFKLAPTFYPRSNLHRSSFSTFLHPYLSHLPNLTNPSVLKQSSHQQFPLSYTPVWHCFSPRIRSSWIHEILRIRGSFFWIKIMADFWAQKWDLRATIEKNPNNIKTILGQIADWSSSCHHDDIVRFMRQEWLLIQENLRHWILIGCCKQILWICRMGGIPVRGGWLGVDEPQAFGWWLEEDLYP